MLSQTHAHTGFIDTSQTDNAHARAFIDTGGINIDNHAATGAGC